MARRFDLESVDRDERLGEAIEHYLALAEEGAAPDPDEFAGRYPDMADDVRAALGGLALVRGLVGESGGGPGGPRLEAGRRVAGYRIVRELGRGGMGVVYEAVHVGLDRPVALKILGTHAAPDSTGRRRFLNEARTAAGLHHTHIVPVFDVGQVGGLCYYAMQRIEGCGLDRVLKALRRDRTSGAGSGSHKPLGPGNSRTVLVPEPPSPSQDETGTWIAGSVGVGPVRDALGRSKEPDEPPAFAPPTGSAYYRWVARVGRQAAEALAHAHSRGIIHRDVKPSNLLIDARGTIWMADFGLARRLADPGMTQADSLLGTPRYMSPEQAEPGPIDGRTDVYSLGATLYELLTLRPPFDGQSAAELVRQIVQREPPPPRATDPKAPRDLETIVLKCLSKRPADRYATAAELAADLDRFLNYEPVKARRISPFGRGWRFTRRHPFSTAVTALAALAIVTITAVAYARVVRERNDAQAAKVATQQALDAQRQATKNEQLALAGERREHLKGIMSQATIVRQSALPGRRKLGLELMREAVKLDTDAALRAKLRDEAVGFLTLRDVEPRPPLAAGPVRSLDFGNFWGQFPLAVLSETDTELRFWDLAKGKMQGKLAVGPPPPGSTPVPGGPRFRHGRLAFGCGSFVAIRPDNAGIRLVLGADARAESWEIDLPGRELLGIELATPMPSPIGQWFWPRLVTIERVRTAEPVGGDADAPPWMTEGFEVNLWELKPRVTTLDEPLATLVHPEVSPFGPRGPLVTVSPDGTTIATATMIGESVTLWDARTGKPIGEPIAAQVHVRALALGPEGLLAVGDGSQVRLWDTEARPSPAALPAFNPHQSRIGLLRFSPDGTLLAVAGGDPGIELWDTSGRALATLTTTDRVEELAFAPDGRSLVAAGRGPNLGVWSIVEPAGRVRLPEFKSRVTCLGFGPDGVLAMASGVDPIRFWWPATNPSTATARCWTDVVPSDFVFDDRGRLIALDAAEVRRYEPPKRRDHHAGHKGPALIDHVALPALTEPNQTAPRIGGPLPAAIAATADGKVVAVSRMGEVWLFRPGAAEPLRSLRLTRSTDRPPGPPSGGRPFGPPQGSPPWRSIALDPAGDRLYLNNPFFGEVRVCAIAGDALREVRSVPAELRRTSTAMALSADGKTLALGDARGNITLVVAATGTVRARLRPTDGETEDRIDALAFAPDGNLLAVGGFERTRLWGLGPAPKPLVSLPGHRGRVSNLAFSPDGRRLATGGDEGAVAVWDLDRIRAELTKLDLEW
ncbi:MAG TPA: protein kinase [Isosphaeraceae bacterium]|jgi:serine/threonine protein kinase/WD40 repeat protein|nr:protein kinase [Isosphaeraceae bacterium]